MIPQLPERLGRQQDIKEGLAEAALHVKSPPLSKMKAKRVHLHPPLPIIVPISNR